MAAARRVCNGGSGGRPTTAQSNKKAKVSERLRLLRLDVLPGESVPRAAPSESTLVAAAALHAVDHAQASTTLTGQIIVDNDSGESSGDNSDDPDHDDPVGEEEEQGGGTGGGGGGGGGDAGAVAAKKKRQSPGKAPLHAAQQKFNERCADIVLSGNGDRFHFHPPAACMRKTPFSGILYTVLPVIVWLPQILFKNMGIPNQPPCPVHGFAGSRGVIYHGRKIIYYSFFFFFEILTNYM